MDRKLKTSLHDHDQTLLIEPIDKAFEKKIMSLSLEIEEEKLVPVSAYKLQPERVSKYQYFVSDLTPQNAVAVTCKATDGSIVETIVNTDTMEQCLFECPVFCEEKSIASLLEAQFVQGGPWTLSHADLEVVTALKSSQWSNTEAFFTSGWKDDQQSYLPRLLRGSHGVHMRTRLCWRKDDSIFRMSESEIKDWGNKSTREVHCLRRWNPETRAYEAVDAALDGAPNTEAALDEWFVKQIQRIIRETHMEYGLDGDDLSKLAASGDCGNSRSWEDLCESWDRALSGKKGTFRNRWTDLLDDVASGRYEFERQLRAYRRAWCRAIAAADMDRSLPHDLPAGRRAIVDFFSMFPGLRRLIGGMMLYYCRFQPQ